MESDRTRKAAAILLGLAIVGLLGVTPGVAATTGSIAGASSTAAAEAGSAAVAGSSVADVGAGIGADPCLEVDPGGPGLSVDPQNCPVISNLTVPHAGS